MAKGNWAGSPSRRLSVCALVAMPGLLLVPRAVAAAQPGPLLPARFVYERTAGAELCPDERGARGTLATLLGEASLDPKASPRILLQVGAPSGNPSPAPAPSGSPSPAAGPDGPTGAPFPQPPRRGEIAGHVELQDAAGKPLWKNDLVAARDDCATLIASLALSLRVAVDELGRPAPSAPPGGAEQAREPIVVRGVPNWPPPSVLDSAAFFHRKPAPDRSTLSTSWPGFRVDAAAAFTPGAAPTAPLRLSLAAGLDFPSLAFVVEVRGFLPAGGRFGGHVLNVTRWEGAFLPCMSRWSVFGCAILSAGSVEGQVAGLQESTVVSFHATVGARMGFLLPVTSRLAVGLVADVEGSPLPARVEMDSLTVWEEASLQLSIGLVASAGFPALQQ